MDTDIYGANLCNEYLQVFHNNNGNNKNQLRNFHRETERASIKWSPEVKSVESILVHTGVSLQDGDNPTNNEGARFLHRDTVFQPHLRRANHAVENIGEAVELILKQEHECSQ